MHILYMYSDIYRIIFEIIFFKTVQKSTIELGQWLNK